MSIVYKGMRYTMTHGWPRPFVAEVRAREQSMPEVWRHFTRWYMPVFRRPEYRYEMWWPVPLAWLLMPLAWLAWLGGQIGRPIARFDRTADPAPEVRWWSRYFLPKLLFAPERWLSDPWRWFYNRKPELHVETVEEAA
jgi:hypothetical protein